MKTIHFLLLLSLTLSCASTLGNYKVPSGSAARQIERDRFVGFWRGDSRTTDGKFAKWLLERRKDGGFTLTIKFMDKANEVAKFDPDHATFEMGIWGISGDIYFTATRQYYAQKKVQSFDTTRADLYSAYKILSFDGASLTYKSLDTGEEFTMRKIPDGEKVDF